MYLTRIPIDVHTRGGLRLLGSPYRIHAAVESSFPADAVRSNELGRILWRVDRSIGRNDCLWLYILSPDRPDCAHIASQAGSCEVGSPETKPYDRVLAAVREGQCWQFRLKANPVRTVLVDKGVTSTRDVRGTVQGHVTEAQQRAWLIARAEAHGFAVVTSRSGAEALSVSDRRRERFRRGERDVTLATAVFDGVLRVTDADAFRHTLGFGVGRAKGFGCGLLTIAPLRGEEGA